MYMYMYMIYSVYVYVYIYIYIYIYNNSISYVCLSVCLPACLPGLVEVLWSDSFRPRGGSTVEVPRSVQDFWRFP